MKHIPVGTLISGPNVEKHLPQILPHGFESFSITFWQTTQGVDLNRLADTVHRLLDGKNIPVSTLSVFGNPLTGHDKNADTLASWERVIDIAPKFKIGDHPVPLITGFTGRLTDKPIPESIPRFTEVFAPLVRRAIDQGTRIAFENCAMGGDWNKGDWNLAHFPAAWELLFSALGGKDPALAEACGLEWEPCHQWVSLIDPVAQLRDWVGKVFHVHGKDATVAKDVIARHGIRGSKPWAWHRHPGFGDTNWSDLITILMQNNYQGTIDIEGWHDPVHKGELEMSGQVTSLEYLKRARGGNFVPNPV